MGDQPGDELLAEQREITLVVRVIEAVFVAGEQGLVQVKAGAVDARHWFRHEGGVHVLELGQFLDHQLGGHQVVGHGQGIGVLEVDFVLAGRALVVRVLDRDAHLSEVEDSVAAEVGGRITGELVEIAVEVQQFRSGGVLQVEEFQFRAHVVGEPQFSGFVQVALEDLARVSDEGLATGLPDIAEHAGHGILTGTPGQQRKRLGIRVGPHVALVVAGEPVDGGSIEAHAALQRVLQIVH